MKKRVAPTFETVELIDATVKTLDDLKRLLDERGEDINEPVVDSAQKNTLLYYFLQIERGLRMRFVTIFLEYGINVNRVSSTGDTYLHEIAWFGDAKMIRLFVDYGADIFAINHSGKSVIQCALSSYDFATVEVLLDLGAKVPTKPEIGTFGYAQCLETWEHAKDYNDIVQKRISSCRKTLLALLSACNASKLHNGAAFGGLKDIMIQMASQAWAMRGGEGCGARGHLWN